MTKLFRLLEGAAPPILSHSCLTLHKTRSELEGTCSFIKSNFSVLCSTVQYFSVLFSGSSGLKGERGDQMLSVKHIRQDFAIQWEDFRY